MVDGGQAGDVADELVQQRWLQQIRLLGDEWLLGQNHVFGSSWVSGQQTPVDVATVTEIRIVTVLLVERSRLVTSFLFFGQQQLLYSLLGLEEQDCHCPVGGKESISYSILIF